jgi:hypothetical protein
MAYAKMEDLTILRAIDDDFAVSLIEEARRILGDDYKPVVVTAEPAGETAAESAEEVAVETAPEDDQGKQGDAGDEHGEKEDNETDGDEG